MFEAMLVEAERADARLPDLPRAGLLDVVAGAEAVLRAVQAVQSHALALLREGLPPDTGEEDGVLSEHARADLVLVGDLARLGAWSEGSVERRLAAAERLHAFPAVRAALARGDLDAWRATTVVAELERVAAHPDGGPGAATALQDRVLAVCAGMPWGRLKDRLDKWTITAAPVVARSAEEAVFTDRGVWLEQLPAGGSQVVLTGTDTECHLIFQRLDDEARMGAAVAAETRTLPQLRFDAALTLAGASTPVADPATDARTTPAVRTEVHVHVPLDALLGADDAPAQVIGMGGTRSGSRSWISGAAVPSLLTRLGDPQSLVDLVVRRVLTDPVAGVPVHVDGSPHGAGYRPTADLVRLVTARHRRCTHPGCVRWSRTCDLDHAVPHAAGGPTCWCNLQPLCRRHHLLKTFRAGAGPVPDVDGSITWRTPDGPIRVPPDPLDDRPLRPVPDDPPY